MKDGAARDLAAAKPALDAALGAIRARPASAVARDLCRVWGGGVTVGGWWAAAVGGHVALLEAFVDWDDMLVASASLRVEELQDRSLLGVALLLAAQCNQLSCVR